MTIREMKQINSEIKKLLKKLERLRSAAINISPQLSGMPPGGFPNGWNAPCGRWMRSPTARPRML